MPTLNSKTVMQNNPTVVSIVRIIVNIQTLTSHTVNIVKCCLRCIFNSWEMSRVRGFLQARWTPLLLITPMATSTGATMPTSAGPI